MFIHNLLKSASVDPDKIAVCHPVRLSYAQLLRAAQNLAQDLALQNKGANQHVPVWTRDPLRCLIGQLAALLCGSSYIPIDPKIPGERLAHILQSSGASAVLVDEALNSALPKAISAISIPALSPAQISHANKIEFDAEEELARTHPDTPIYVIYTSGSTGIPNGVLISQQNIDHFIGARRRLYGEPSCFMPLHPQSFDPAQGAYLWTLACGGCLALPSAEEILDIDAIADLIAKHNVSHLSSVPIYYDKLLDIFSHRRAHLALQYVLLGGEALGKVVANKHFSVFENVRLFNEYGPTETTIFSTVYEVGPDCPSPIPIGYPVYDNSCHILDDDRRQVADGEFGELYITGPGVGIGYLGNNALTEKRFVNVTLRDGSTQRAYRSGDKVRRNEKGELEIAGRIDFQIKLRGNRIEPGEIEAHLQAHARLRAAAVVLVEHGTPALHCFYTSLDREPIANLREFLFGKVPSHMLPSAFHHLPELPLSNAGKVDRKSLANMKLSSDKVDSVATPLTSTESRIADIWKSALELDDLAIHADDDFFSLGGDSLSFAKVVNRIRSQFQIELAASALYQLNTLADLSRYVDSCTSSPCDSEADNEPGLFPIAPIQEVFFYLSQIAPESTAYIETAAIKITGPLERQRLIDAINTVVNKHDSLRASFAVQDTLPNMRVHGALSVDVPVYDTKVLGDNSTQALREYLLAPFELHRPPLFRFCIEVDSCNSVLLHFAAHHIIVDGISIGHIYKNIWSAYDEAEKFGGHSPRPYHHFAEASRRSLSGEYLDTLKSFWSAQLAEAGSPSELPNTYLPGALADAVGREYLRFDNSISHESKSLCSRLSCSPFMLHLSVLGTLLHRLTSEHTLVLGTPVSLRQRQAWEEIIGCFVNPVALKLSVASGEQPFSEFAAAVKAQVLMSLQHAEIPFSWIQETVLDRHTSATKGPHFKIFLNYIDHRNNRFASRSGLNIEESHQNISDAKFDLTLYVHEYAEHCDLECCFDAALYSSESIRALLQQYQHLLRQLLRNPELPLADYSLRVDQSELLLRGNVESFPHSDRQLQDAFFNRAETNPRQCAIHYQSRDISYAELSALSLDIAERIQHCLADDERLAILLPRSALLCASAIAALEAQRVFTILDPNQPAQHQRGVLNEFKAAAILVHGETQAAAALLDSPHVNIIDLNNGGRSQSSQHSQSSRRGQFQHRKSSAPAYAVFTSGTTGQPKGVLATHAPATLFVEWQQNTFALDERDTFSLLSGLSHDPLIRDIFTPLSIGATLCIPSEKEYRDAFLLADWMRHCGITVSHQTPSLAQTIFAQGEPFDTLRYLFLSGERLFAHDIARIKKTCPNVRILNCYGATETPQIASCQDISDISTLASIPVGRGNRQFDIAIINARGGHCATGEIGEIVVISPHLGRSYLTREGEVALHFPSDSGLPQYRTGDLGRYDVDMNIHVIGRADRQLKIRGYRIEPAAIEAVLRSNENIGDQQILPVDKAHDQVELAAFIVLNKGHSLSEPELREFLADKLINAAVPRHIVFLQRLPLNANGKVDDKALLAEFASRHASTQHAIEPRTQTEEIITAIWREVLDDPTLGANSNFFEAGGDSMQAVKALILLNEKFSDTFSLETLADNPSPAQFAQMVFSQSSFREEQLLVKINTSGSKPPFWMLHPVGGHVIFARRFSKKLGDDWPVYGIQARGLDGRQAPFTNLKEMAAFYIQLIKEVQPKGPYYLGGPSMGGRIALEVAQQLIASGNQVGRLIMFDTWAQGFPCKGPLLTRALLKGRKLLGKWSKIPSVQSPAQQDPKDIHYVDYHVHRDEAETARVSSRFIQAVVEANQMASRSYLFSHYPGTVTLFSGTILPPWEGVDFSDTSKGWRRWAQDVDIIPIHSDHQHIMDEPALSDVVREFKKLY